MLFFEMRKVLSRFTLMSAGETREFLEGSNV
jgi:hypothetical protein